MLFHWFRLLIMPFSLSLALKFMMCRKQLRIQVASNTKGTVWRWPKSNTSFAGGRQTVRMQTPQD